MHIHTAPVVCPPSPLTLLSWFLRVPTTLEPATWFQSTPCPRPAPTLHSQTFGAATCNQVEPASHRTCGSHATPCPAFVAWSQCCSWNRAKARGCRLSPDDLATLVKFASSLLREGVLPQLEKTMIALNQQIKNKRKVCPSALRPPVPWLSSRRWPHPCFACILAQGFSMFRGLWRKPKDATGASAPKSATGVTQARLGYTHVPHCTAPS